MRILIAGEWVPHGKARLYRRAFEQLSVQVAVVDSLEYYTISFSNRLLNLFLRQLIPFKASWGIQRYYGAGRFNSVVIERVSDYKPDLVFFVKPILVPPETVQSVKKMGALAFSWYPDDAMNPRTASPQFYKSIPFYDCHFTTKSYNVQNFLALGAKRVRFLPHSIDSALYCPVSVSVEEAALGSDIVFVGTNYENERSDLLEALCREGFNIKVYGERWNKLSKKSCLRKRGCVQYRPAYLEDYCKVMSASKIALGLLAKVIPEQHTVRTFEIPACGAFMLHERTDEAMSFFEEGKEAEFFGSFEELVEKIKYYLAHDAERRKIAEAGHRKATSEGFSYRSRAREILKIYEEINQ